MAPTKIRDNQCKFKINIFLMLTHNYDKIMVTFETPCYQFIFTYFHGILIKVELKKQIF